MITTIELINYLDDLLKPGLFADYAPNGLQVEGKSDIKKIITGVSACQLLLDKAIEQQADAVLVHHGYFWKGENPCVTGIKKNRLKSLLQHDINLIAYHLPLDAHLQFGNNAMLAKLLDLQISRSNDPTNLLFHGELLQPHTPEQLADLLAAKLGRSPLHIKGLDDSIQKVAWCTGAAQDLIDKAYQIGAQAFITGEVSERTVHFARESGIHFYAAGHHATEKYGIISLGKQLASHFHLEHEFIDIDNPV